MHDLAERYLGHLITQGEFVKAAALCRAWSSSPEMWQRWVRIFEQNSQPMTIGRFVPTSESEAKPIDVRAHLLLSR